jgi:hypothetical protein
VSRAAVGSNKGLLLKSLLALPSCLVVVLFGFWLPGILANEVTDWYRSCLAIRFSSHCSAYWFAGNG